MKAWKVLTILMVVALGVAMSAQATMQQGTPGDGIPDIYIDIIPAGYIAPNDFDFGAGVFSVYADPDIDTLGIWIDADGATIGNYINIAADNSDAGDPFMFDYSIIAEPKAGGAVFTGTAMQNPASHLAPQGNSSAWTGAWTLLEGNYEIAYASTNDAATMTGAFWTGQILAPGIDPASLYETLHATYVTPAKGELEFTLIAGIPEPSTLVLLASAALGLVLLRRRNN